MPYLIPGLPCLRLALAVICCAGLCPAQNDNGRFVASAYVGVLGRRPVVWQGEPFPYGIDQGGWTYWTTQMNTGQSRDNIVNAFLVSNEYNGPNGLKNRFLQNPPSCAGLPYTPPTFPQPSDPNYSTELFVYMLYYYALDRCPDPGGYAFWVNGLVSGWPIGSVVADFLLHPGGEFLNWSPWSTQYQAGHKAALDNFLFTVNPSFSPYASAVWFGDQQGGTDTVTVGAYNLFHIDFQNFEGSSEISQARVMIGGGCTIQYTQNSQTLTMLNATASPAPKEYIRLNGRVVAIESGGMTPGLPGHIQGTTCTVDVAGSSAHNPGKTLSLYLLIAFNSPGTYQVYGRAWALNQSIQGPPSGSLGTVIVN